MKSYLTLCLLQFFGFIFFNPGVPFRGIAQFCLFFMDYYFFIFFLSCAHPIIFGMKVHSIGFSVLCFSFVPH